MWREPHAQRMPTTGFRASFKSMRTIARRSAALTIFVSLTLSACGSSEDSSDGDSSSKGDTSSKSDSESSDDSDDGTPFGAKPATGEVVKGSAYSYSVPEGWTVPKESPAGFNFDSLATDASDKDGFSDNINIVLDPTIVGVDDDKLETAIKNVLEGVKATDIVVEDEVEVDGEDALHARAIFEQNGVKYRTEQFVIEHDGKGYIATVSFSENVPEAERDQVSGSILATWKWAS